MDGLLCLVARSIVLMKMGTDPQRIGILGDGLQAWNICSE